MKELKAFRKFLNESPAFTRNRSVARESIQEFFGPFKKNSKKQELLSIAKNLSHSMNWAGANKETWRELIDTIKHNIWMVTPTPFNVTKMVLNDWEVALKKDTKRKQRRKTPLDPLYSNDPITVGLIAAGNARIVEEVIKKAVEEMGGLVSYEENNKTYTYEIKNGDLFTYIK